MEASMSVSVSPLAPPVPLVNDIRGPAAGRRQPRGALCELRELTYRYRTRTDPNGEVVRVARSLDNWDATAAVLGQLLEDEAVEVLGVLCLTTRRQIICWHEVSRGGLAGTSCQIGDVFRPAIVANADAIVVAHNHPSGDPEPSGDDLRMTRMLCQVGVLIGVRVVDHLVVGHRGFVSLKRVHPALFNISINQKYILKHGPNRGTIF
jgi:DNA repair protein RadC